MITIIEKNTAAYLDYKWDWNQWLASDEIITSSSVLAPAGLTVELSSITDEGKSVTAWLSGGTFGTEYEVVCTIETDKGRTDKRSINIYMTNR